MTGLHVIYLFLILLYLPGLYFITKKNGLIDKPLISFYLLTSFIFIAIGSYAVLLPNSYYHCYFSYKYICMLFLQLFLFYLCLFLKDLRKLSSIAWVEKVIIMPYSFHRKNVYIIWFLSFCIVIFYVSNNGLPLGFNFDNWFIDDIRLIRQKETYIRGFWLIEDGFYTLPSLATIYAYIIWSFDRNKSNFFLFICSLLIAIIFSFSFLFKKFLLLLFVFIMFVQIFKSRSFRFNHLFLLLLFLFGILSFFFVLYVPDRSTDFYFQNLFYMIADRITLPYTVDMALVVNFIPSVYPFFYGTTLINPLGIFSFNPINLSQFTMLLKSGMFGNAPVPFLAEGYANFGLLGTLVFFLLVLFSLPFLTRICDISKDILSTIFLTIVISYYTFDVSFLSIHTVFSPILLIRISFFALLVHFRCKIKLFHRNYDSIKNFKSESC